MTDWPELKLALVTKSAVEYQMEPKMENGTLLLASNHLEVTWSNCRLLKTLTYKSKTSKSGQLRSVEVVAQPQLQLVAMIWIHHSLDATKIRDLEIFQHLSRLDMETHKNASSLVPQVDINTSDFNTQVNAGLDLLMESMERDQIVNAI